MMRSERRSQPRMAVSLELRLADGRHARVRNVCTQGIYLELPPHAHIDPWVAVEVSSPDGRVRFRATAQVLRIERRGQRTGVALRLHQAKLLAASGNPDPDL